MSQNRLESEAEYILREAKALFKNPVILWAGGKDSTTALYLAKQAFAHCRNIPFPVLFIDTGFKFRETYDFMNRIERAWGINLIRQKDEKGMAGNISPKTHPVLECCNLLKTIPLKNAIRKYGFDGVIVSIRWDEEGIRSKEDYFSHRNDPSHTRIHPLINWSEKDIWRFIKKNNVPYNPLYDLACKGGMRYRSIGCFYCTKPVPKETLSERAGRQQDTEELMEDLRKEGYM